MSDFLLLLPPAYIDGGSASLFFQALIAGLLAAGFMAKSQIFMLWTKVKGIFVKKGADGR